MFIPDESFHTLSPTKIVEEPEFCGIEQPAGTGIGQFNSITPACLNDLIYPYDRIPPEEDTAVGRVAIGSVGALRPAADNMVFNSPAACWHGVLSALLKFVSVPAIFELKVKSALARKIMRCHPVRPFMVRQIDGATVTFALPESVAIVAAK